VHEEIDNANVNTCGRSQEQRAQNDATHYGSDRGGHEKEMSRPRDNMMSEKLAGLVRRAAEEIRKVKTAAPEKQTNVVEVSWEEMKVGDVTNKTHPQTEAEEFDFMKGNAPVTRPVPNGTSDWDTISDQEKELVSLGNIVISTDRVESHKACRWLVAEGESPTNSTEDCRNVFKAKAKEKYDVQLLIQDGEYASRTAGRSACDPEENTAIEPVTEAQGSIINGSGGINADEGEETKALSTISQKEYKPGTQRRVDISAHDKP
jgi:hypothetical protein